MNSLKQAQNDEPAPAFNRPRIQGFALRRNGSAKRDNRSRNDRRQNCDMREKSLEFAPRPRDLEPFSRLKGTRLLSAALDEVLLDQLDRDQCNYPEEDEDDCELIVGENYDDYLRRQREDEEELEAYRRELEDCYDHDYSDDWGLDFFY